MIPEGIAMFEAADILVGSWNVDPQINMGRALACKLENNYE